MLNLKEESNFKSLLDSLAFLMKDLSTKITFEFEESNKKNELKEYSNWKKYNKEDPEKFIIETMYVLFNRILLLFVCEDKGIIKNNIREYNEKSNTHYFIKNIYSNIEKWYPHLFINTTFDWYKPDNKTVSKILDKLSKYDFNTVNRDILGKLYEQFLPREERKRLGQFYTPEEVIDYILYKVGFREDRDILNRRIIDISCGSGGFLIRAIDILINKMIKENYKKEEIITQVQNNIFGLDINAFACHLAETNVLFRILDLIKEAISENPNFRIDPLHIYNTNSLDKKNTFFNKDNQTVSNIKIRREEFKDGFDFVVGNPPYIEMKIMDKETKEICKKNFQKLCKGSFDVFICFIKLGLDLLKHSGKFGYIIPNKFLTAKYASILREHILTNMNIDEIVNVSNIEVFKKTSVYPIIIIVENNHNEDNEIILKPDIKKLNLLNGNSDNVLIKQKSYNMSEDKTFFFLPKDKIERNIILKIIDSETEKLSNILKVKWSVSFHKNGLRDKFIHEKSSGKYSKKILGGKAFGGNTEVQRYKLEWSGYWIDYDEERAKEISNQFPPRDIFEREKIIICQNSKRIRATYDNQHYYCKDIFFVGYLKDKAKETDINIKYLLAVLNSKLMSYFYSIIFSGTHIGGGYLHYLPIYLDSLPIKISSDKEQKEIIKLVDEILGKNISDSKFSEIDNEIDKKIYHIYGIKDEEKNIIEKIVKEKLEVGN